MIFQLSSLFVGIQGPDVVLYKDIEVLAGALYCFPVVQRLQNEKEFSGVQLLIDFRCLPARRCSPKLSLWVRRCEDSFITGILFSIAPSLQRQFSSVIKPLWLDFPHQC